MNINKTHVKRNMQFRSSNYSVVNVLVCTLLFEAISSIPPARGFIPIQNLTTAIVGPKYFLVGASRSGTQNFQSLLTSRKQLCELDPINIGFFSDDYAYKHGKDSYDSYFRNCDSDVDHIDLSSSYFSNNLVPQRMNESFGAHLSRKRLFVLLREPVAREFSKFSALVEECVLHMEGYLSINPVMPTEGWDDEALYKLCNSRACKALNCNTTAKHSQEPNLHKRLISFKEYYLLGYLDLNDSIYVNHLKNYLRYFKRDQVLVLNFHRLLKEAPNLMNRVKKFLGISQGWGTAVKFPRKGFRAFYNIDCETRDALQKVYEPYNEELYAFLRATRDDNRFEPSFKTFPDARNMTCGMDRSGGPKFFLIGAQKAGTTSLHQLLVTHPDICGGSKKEVHFFDRPSSYQRGVQYGYFKFFQQCDKGDHAHFIDSTPDYLMTPEAPARMHSTLDLSGRKLIVVLRDPVAREFSFFKHLMGHCIVYIDSHIVENDRPADGWSRADFASSRHCNKLQLTMSDRLRFVDMLNITASLPTFREYLKGGNIRLNNSIYVNHLRNYLNYFSRQQLLILGFDFLLGETEAAAVVIQSFLNISKFWPHEELAELPHENVAGVDVQLDCVSRDELQLYYAQHNADLYELLARPGAPPVEPPFARFKLTRCADEGVGGGGGG